LVQFSNFEIDLTDVLKYADLLDGGDYKIKGKSIYWNTEQIDPASSKSKIFALKMKNKFPIVSQKNKLIHFSSYDTESFNAVNQVRDTRSLPSQLYETKEIYNALYKAINKLDKSEKVIILGIYFKNYSLRKLASIRHTNAMAISRQRDKILKKLKKDLIKFDDYY